jgi:membrane protein DedA with SNARE-associated domain
MTAYFSDITDFIARHPHYAAWAVFGLAFSEAIPIVGTVVPGSTLIVAISALAIEAAISPWLLLVAATLGAIAGDGTSFWLGQRCHRQILQRWPLNQFPQLIARSEAFFIRYGGASVFLARFTAVVRAFVPLIAGIVRMPARQFYVANILSAIVWAPAHVFPGVVFGLLVRLAGARPEQIFILAVAAMFLGVIVIRLVRYFIKRRAAGGSEPAQ